MIGKPIYLSQVAQLDLQEIISNYEKQCSIQAVNGCLDSLSKAYQQISQFPKTGSTRTGNEVQLSDLRSWPLTKYPYLLFYKEDDAQIDCWRLLHEKRDTTVHIQYKISQ